MLMMLLMMMTTMSIYVMKLTETIHSLVSLPSSHRSRRGLPDGAEAPPRSSPRHPRYAHTGLPFSLHTLSLLFISLSLSLARSLSPSLSFFLSLSLSLSLSFSLQARVRCCLSKARRRRRRPSSTKPSPRTRFTISATTCASRSPATSDLAET